MISSGFAKDLNTRLCHNWKLVLFIVLPILLSPIAWAIPHKGPDDDPNKVCPHFFTRTGKFLLSSGVHLISLICLLFYFRNLGRHM